MWVHQLFALQRARGLWNKRSKNKYVNQEKENINGQNWPSDILNRSKTSRNYTNKVQKYLFDYSNITNAKFIEGQKSMKD